MHCFLVTSEDQAFTYTCSYASSIDCVISAMTLALQSTTVDMFQVSTWSFILGTIIAATPRLLQFHRTVYYLTLHYYTIISSCSDAVVLSPFAMKHILRRTHRHNTRNCVALTSLWLTWTQTETPNICSDLEGSYYLGDSTNVWRGQ